MENNKRKALGMGLEQLFNAQSVDLKKAKKISFDGFDSENAYSYCEKEPYTPGYCGVIFNSKKLD